MGWFGAHRTRTWFHGSANAPKLSAMGSNSTLLRREDARTWSSHTDAGTMPFRFALWSYERTRTAFPCSSYEFACARSSPFYCVQKLPCLGGFRRSGVSSCPVRASLYQPGCSTGCRKFGGAEEMIRRLWAIISAPLGQRRDRRLVSCRITHT